ncbi:hypothetical protein COCCADRAFT_40635 [Bipolaris zeicola 26-R-13]|uniref:Cytochrome P450 n=1 Tax=Cochliobolus carbonum (strain 26-R-13) TaxID=930089 RepID=W6XUP7_COCC2|nr:uncharacterized protein COCCADRAFT_40635 [Bipolaris zeicola 26-R-13]EUC28925.1 hypothetical protein COCCADRAFT_40635 [Bipolaris zeicola 26-R-13]
MIDVVHNKTLSLFSVSPIIYIFVLIAAIPPILWVRHLATKQRPLREVPILNANEQTPGESWHTKPRELLSKGIRLYPDQPFQIITHGGPRIALPRRYLEEVRDSQQAAFPPYFLDEAPWNLPGFDGLLRATNMRLITESLADEGILATEDLFGNLAPGQWHTIILLPEATKIIGRFPARAMLGEEIAHNHEYIDISMKYGATALTAALRFRSWPRILWPIIQYFIPLSKTARYQTQRTDQKLDIVGFQLAISMAAIHNTSGHLFTALWCLIAHPKYISLLREEAISVLKEYGWTRQALARLKLQDAVHEECMRILRGNLRTARRQVVKGNLTFSDGFTIPNSRRFFVMPPADYQGENEEFYPERWLEKQEEGQANKYSFITVNLENPEFGIGKHACPGRWFANDEMKIALCILLLRYDWKATPGMPKPLFDACEDFPTFKSSLQVQITPREPEIDLASSKM